MLTKKEIELLNRAQTMGKLIVYPGEVSVAQKLHAAGLLKSATEPCTLLITPRGLELLEAAKNPKPIYARRIEIMKLLESKKGPVSLITIQINISGTRREIIDAIAELRSEGLVRRSGVANETDRSIYCYSLIPPASLPAITVTEEAVRMDCKNGMADQAEEKAVEETEQNAERWDGLS